MCIFFNQCKEVKLVIVFDVRIKASSWLNDFENSKAGKSRANAKRLLFFMIEEGTGILGSV